MVPMIPSLSPLIAFEAGDFLVIERAAAEEDGEVVQRVPAWALNGAGLSHRPL